jgi:hypothetical protein
MGRASLFLALGGDAPADWIGQAEVRFVAYQKKCRSRNRNYQGADVYVLAPRADTFRNTAIKIRSAVRQIKCLWLRESTFVRVNSSCI